MSNRYAEKVKKRREKIKNSRNQIISLRPNKYLFWVYCIVLLSVIIFLSYQAYSRGLVNELIIPIAIAVTLLFLLIVWFVPKFYIQSLPDEAGKSFDKEKERLKLEDDTRKTFAQIVGGVVILGGLIFTYNTYRIQVEQVKIQTKQQEIAQEGQITDRFTKAVTQIGDEKLEIRLGGLYALERIAKDSPRDHWSVMEIISAYVRERTKTKGIIRKEAAKTNAKEVKNSKGNKAQLIEMDIEDVKITTDIQAALTIIGRRNVKDDKKDARLDLTEIFLNGAKITQANFEGADFRDTDFSMILFWKDENKDSVNVYRSGFVESKLTKSNFERADLRGAIFDKSELREVNFDQADLRGASFNNSDLSGAVFRASIFNLTLFFGTDLRGCEDLTYEQLSKAIINVNTLLPSHLIDKRENLLEISKKNLELRNELYKPQ